MAELPQNNDAAKLMKKFWNTKAREHAPFYIATWRGYERKDLEGFFLTAEEAGKFLAEADYQPAAHQRMLEIGCGIGRVTHGFAQVFEEVYAIDVSGEMIEQARANLAQFQNVSLAETNGVDLKIYDDNFFDFCFSFIVFQHIPEKSIIFNYIKEVGRVLKPGGVFHFQVSGLPNPDLHEQPLVLRIKKLYRHYVRRPVLLTWSRLRGGPGGFESPAWGGISLTFEEVRNVCASSGLEITKTTGAGTAYFWITAKKRS